MTPFRVGDRVRLGAARGGIVFRRREGFAVRWPDDRTGWLDHCVPDDGPDGRIFPNEWDACEGCGQPTPAIHCVNCRARHATDTARPIATAPAPLAFPAPSRAVHCAGAPVPYVGRPGVQVQPCARCGAVLRCVGDLGSLPETLPSGGFYPVGALIERGAGWQAYSLIADAPTCEPEPF